MGLRGSGRGPGGLDRARVDARVWRRDGAGRGLDGQCTKSATFGGNFVVFEGRTGEADGGVQPDLAYLVLRRQA